ncbi:MerR family transcriptional regulator [Streptococcus dentapri]|uniref:MerR family transcriptional regulator n=1 Tax=Streptococcus dentapri TaxID=573564 RepID=A0ABV8D3T3_9STRE
MKTVKEVSQLSGVSVRTLHHYDAVGLLPPTATTEAGYRLYDDRALERLQEILLFRELEFSLKDIKAILDSNHYDRAVALTDQIRLLELRRQHLDDLIVYARNLQKQGGHMMNFKAFDKAELEAFEAEAKKKWGDTSAYQEFKDRTSEKDFAQISQEGMMIFAQIGQLKHLAADDSQVQEQIRVLQDYISSHFYECTPEILAGLGRMYAGDNRFKTSIDQAGGIGTADFAARAIDSYCQK